MFGKVPGSYSISRKDLQRLIEVKDQVHIKTQKITYYVSILLAVLLQLFLENGVEKLNIKHRTSRQPGKAAGSAVSKDFLTGPANGAFAGVGSAPGPVASTSRGVNWNDENGK